MSEITSRKTAIPAHLIPVSALVLLSLFIASCNGEDNQGTQAARPSPIGSSEPASSQGSEADLGTGPALVWGSGQYGVVLVHGAIYDAASWTDQATAIAARGFAVIAPENATADDTRAAMDYLRRTFGVSHVALVGASAGTGPVLAVARDRIPDSEPSVDLVIVLAGSGTVDGLDVPSVLFISAEGDSGAAAAAERMLNATSGDEADLLIVPGRAHAQALFKEPEGDLVLSAIQERLDERKVLVLPEP